VRREEKRREEKRRDAEATAGRETTSLIVPQPR
jgi:hypothetical protein